MARVKTVKIASELVANVLEISVAVGDRVEAGAQMALLESMKMEIPMLTEFAGTVVEVVAQVGDVVQDGDVLVVVES